MIRILQCVNNMHRAGLETMLMNYYRNMDRTKIQFDFLTHRPVPGDYDEEIKKLGGRVYYAPRLYPQNYPAYFCFMKHFFKEHPEYQIMHSHIDSMSYLPLLAGKLAGVPVRIAHSHNTNIDKDFKYMLKQSFRMQLPLVATDYLACGEQAGRYLFGKHDFKVIANAIDAKSFYYDEEKRTAKRAELGYGEEFVMGHVGRLSYQKNHRFLIEIFREVVKIHENSRLMLVGIGEKEAEIKEQVRKSGLEDKVDFMGNRDDVNELYQAMDIFVLPSFFEGVPVVGIEAQFANLPCIFSNKVPEEVRFSKKAYFLSLHRSSEEWASFLCKFLGWKRNPGKSQVLHGRYDISQAYKELQDYYLELSTRI